MIFQFGRVACSLFCVLFSLALCNSFKAYSNRYSASQLRSTKLDSFDARIFQKSQWNLLSKYHVGEWKGVQTGYDPTEENVADHMYFDITLEKNPDGNCIKQINSIVMSEIRTDCEVCFDSEKTKTKEVGIFTEQSIKSRLCENVELKGPGTTPRGLSCEAIFRHNDNRVRVLLALSPLNWEEIDGLGTIPDSMILQDIVISRESLNKRPLQIENNIHNLWSPIENFDNIFNKKYNGKRYRNTANGQQDILDLNMNNLPKLSMDSSSSSNNNNGIIHVDDESIIDTDIYTRIFPGGIKVECPKILTAGVETSIRITWAPLPTSSTSNLNAMSIEDTAEVYAAEYKFTALDIIQDSNGKLRLSPPILKDFFVDKFYSQ
eukprot:gene3304-6542_t